MIAVCTLAACGHLGFGDGTDGTPLPPGRWQFVATGASWACGIALDQTLWCWGHITDNPTGLRIQPPAQVGTAKWESIAVSTYDSGHACGIQSDKSLWCWGDNTAGQLGDNTTAFALVPEQITNAKWNAIAVGGDKGYTCGIQADGSLWCWGDNESGELGDGTTTNQLVPEQIGTAKWTSLALGNNYVCGIQSDGSLSCWGSNNYGQLGDGTTNQQLTPEKAIGGSWTAVAAASVHTCAVDNQQGLWCWGDNGDGELGTGDQQAQSQPLFIAESKVAVAVGDRHTCAIDVNGQLECFGNAAHGQLADAQAGSNGYVLSPTPVSDFHAVRVAAGGDQTCLVDDEHHLVCTGRNDVGQLGSSPGEAHVPVRADTRTNWATLSASGSHACGTTADGMTWCWGGGGDGELGDGTQFDRQQPVNAGVGYAQVVTGPTATIGLMADGSAWLWGYDGVAQADMTTAEQLAANGWTTASVGSDHDCNVASGALWCRGSNSCGQLGDGTNNDSSGVAVSGQWAATSANNNTTCAIAAGTNALFCWGDGGDGQIGNGSSGTFSSPQPVAITGATRIAVGGGFACAIDTAGALWCWGTACDGELGDDDTSSNATPTQVGTRSDWSELATGGAHACAIPSDGTLWCWGSASEGETGHAAAVDKFDAVNDDAPYQVGTDTDWAHVAAGDSFTCALKRDGSRWCFGQDTNGELGNGLAWQTDFVAVP